MIPGLTHLFEHTFSRRIWQALPAMNGNNWVLELREKETKQVSYAMVDLEAAFGPDNQAVWEYPVAATEWWTSLAGVGRTHFFLHNYRDPEIPEPTDFLAVNKVTGDVDWVQPGYRFSATRPDGVLEIAKRTGGEIVYYECHEASGNVGALTRRHSPSEVPGLQYPVRYKTGDPYFETITDFLDKTLNSGPLHTIDYLEFKSYMVFSYYLYENEKMVQYLAVIDRWKSIKYHQQVADAIHQVGMDTFLLKNDTLVFVRNKNVFAGINFKI